MLKVALTGGLATGKSTVGQMFADLGGHLIEADRLGHEALAGEAREPVAAAFGPGILREDGSIDRRKLAAIVFPHPDQLERLTALVHPVIDRLRQARFAAIAAREPAAIVFYEAAIHIETGLYKGFDRLVLVTCREELQISRAMERSHWTREETLARIRQQMPLADKRKFADYVIDTSESPEATRRQTEEIYNELKGLVLRDRPH